MQARLIARLLVFAIAAVSGTTLVLAQSSKPAAAPDAAKPAAKKIVDNRPLA